MSILLQFVFDQHYTLTLWINYFIISVFANMIEILWLILCTAYRICHPNFNQNTFFIHAGVQKPQFYDLKIVTNGFGKLYLTTRVYLRIDSQTMSINEVIGIRWWYSLIVQNVQVIYHCRSGIFRIPVVFSQKQAIIYPMFDVELLKSYYLRIQYKACRYL